MAGIPRMLYDSVRDPLLPAVDHQDQYGVTSPTTPSSTTSTCDSNFSAALNPARSEDGYMEDAELQITDSGVPQRYQRLDNRSTARRTPGVDESGTMINTRKVVNRSTEIPGKRGAGL